MPEEKQKPKLVKDFEEKSERAFEKVFHFSGMIVRPIFYIILALVLIYFGLAKLSMPFYSQSPIGLIGGLSLLGLGIGSLVKTFKLPEDKEMYDIWGMVLFILLGILVIYLMAT